MTGCIPLTLSVIAERLSWRGGTRAALLAVTAMLVVHGPSRAQDWTGSASSDWFNPANWSSGSIPTGSGDASIDAVSPHPATVGSPGAEAANLYVGELGTGTLNIQNGGTVSSSLSYIGYNAGSNGTVTVSGPGSSWTPLSGYFGYGGTGTLNIFDGGTVSNTFTGTIGQLPGSTGTVTVSGPGSSWTGSDRIYVGLTGTGTLNIENGGTVSGNEYYIADFAGSTGTVTVSGNGSSLTSTNLFEVGVNSGTTATVNILNGGTVTTLSGTLGSASNSTGTVTVDGLGSGWDNTNTISIGYDGIGTLNIQNGGTVSAADVRIAQFLGSTGTLNIGAGSGQTPVAPGTLNTPTVTFGTGTGQIVFNHTDTNYTFAPAISGAGSVIVENGTTTLGSNSSYSGWATVNGGTLKILNGVAVSDSIGAIGDGSGSNGTVTVSGAGSVWNNSGLLYVGNAGAGTLNILDGGAVSDSGSIIGNAAASTGIVTVDGAGSSWNSSDIYVGYSATGTLSILNGGTVNGGGSVAINAGSTGTVTIGGAGSSWNYGTLDIGFNGSGTLNILNGGAASGASGYIGRGSGATGTVTVSGAGSSWTTFSGAFDGIIQVGSAGTGTLNILDGGSVSNSYSYIGNLSGSIGTASVDGAGSSWTISNDLFVGGAGAGVLNIRNGGTVSAQSVTIASTGTLNIGSASGDQAVGAGILDTPTVAFGAGTGRIVFNHTDTNYTFAPAISGSGSLLVENGTTILTGNSTYSGPTTIDGGKLVVNGSIVSDVTVNDGGTLGGIGSIGDLVASSGGTLAPGNSIGTLTVNGDASLALGSTYEVELNAAGQSDLIHATGMVTIADGALLDVVKTGTAPLALGTQYTVLQADGGLTVNGDGPSIIDNLAYLTFIGSYDASNYYLTSALLPGVNSFCLAGMSANQCAAGNGAFSLGAGNSVFDAVLNLTTADEAAAALDSLSGEVHASLRGVLLDDSRFPREAALNRLRGSLGGVGASNQTVAVTDGRRSYRSAAPTTGRLAFWGHGFGSWGKWDGDDNAAKFDRNTGGMIVGADGAVLDTWRLGGFAGYSRTNFDVDARNASGSSDSYHVGLYGGSNFGSLAFRSGLAYSWHDVTTARSVVFPGFSDSLKADYDLGTAQAFGEVGYGVQAGAIALEPFANLAHVSLRTGGFTESGGTAALTSTSSVTDATFTTLGLRTSTKLTIGTVDATGRGSLGWRHAFGDTLPSANLAFVGGGSPFTVTGVPVAQDTATLDLGLDVNVAPGAVLGVSYGGQFGSAVTDQTVRANFSAKF